MFFFILRNTVFASLLLGLFGTQAQADAFGGIDGIMGCQLHSDANRSGDRLFIPSQWVYTSLPSFNDKTSALFVSDSCTLTVWVDTNKSGSNKVFSSGTYSNLTTLDWNDKISSASCMCSKGYTDHNYDHCMTFEDENFRGGARGVGRNEMSYLGPMDNKASSTIVAKGCTLIGYDTDDEVRSINGEIVYPSTTTIGYGTHKNMPSGWNDKISNAKCTCN